MNKNIYKYTIFIEPAEEGGYISYVPVLPDCFSQGETIEEVKKMTEDAIKGYIEVLIEEGEEIPREPKEMMNKKANGKISKIIDRVEKTQNIVDEIGTIEKVVLDTLYIKDKVAVDLKNFSLISIP